MINKLMKKTSKLILEMGQTKDKPKTYYYRRVNIMTKDHFHRIIKVLIGYGIIKSKQNKRNPLINLTDKGEYIYKELLGIDGLLK